MPVWQPPLDARRRPSAMEGCILEIFCCDPKGSRALLRILSTEGRGVRLCGEHSKPKGPNGVQESTLKTPWLQRLQVLSVDTRAQKNSRTSWGTWASGSTDNFYFEVQCQLYTLSCWRVCGIFYQLYYQTRSLKIGPLPGATPFPTYHFSGFQKGCKGHKTHRFENGGTNQLRKHQKLG